MTSPNKPEWPKPYNNYHQDEASSAYDAGFNSALFLCNEWREEDRKRVMGELSEV